MRSSSVFSGRLSLVSLLLMSACSKSAQPGSHSELSATSASAGASVVTAPPAAPRLVPADINLDGLQKELACAGGKGKNACRLLADFSGAGRWTGQLPSGRGRWVGNVYKVEQRAEQHSLLVFAAEQVPTSQVGVGDLPLRVGWGPLPDEYRAHGIKLVNLVSHGDAVSKKNQALPFVKSFAPSHYRGAEITLGASVRLISEEPTYIRQKSARALILLNPRAGAAGAPGDGTYAELWLADW